MLSIRHHKDVFVRFSTEINDSSPIENKSEIPPDKRQAKFDLGVAVIVDIALKPGMLSVSFDHVSTRKIKS